MKKHFLPESGTFYKANLHCHTKASDGAYTAEVTKQHYKERGYSILAITDHNVMIDNSHLIEPDFVVLNGVEYNINMQPYQAPRGSRSSAEFNFIAPTPDTKLVCFQEKYAKYTTPDYMARVMKDENEEPFERYYSPECANEMMRIAREAGYFVSYNHPLGSQENYLVYTKYRGMHAMEILNYGGEYFGNHGYAPGVYDDICKTGNIIYCIATDDAHSEVGAYGGYTMVKADKLDYITVMDALKAGNFYSSSGAVINDIWYEDGYVHITCENAQSVYLNTGTTFGGFVHAEGDEPLTKASFKLHPLMKYVRLTVVDKNQNRAWSNAYPIKEFLHEIKE